jgi:hypothetical protein
MKRTIIAVGASLAALTAAPAALAQGKGEFGQQGQFILSADRLVPLLSFDNVSQDALTGAGNPAVKSITNTQSSTSLSILYGGMANPGEQFFTAPRVGFDYVLIPNVTIGGSIIALFSLGGSNKTETDLTNGQTQTTSTDNNSVTGFGFAPRGGYILPLSDMFALWLRGGLSYYIASNSQPNNNNNSSGPTTAVNQLSLDLEPQLVLTAIPHVGFTAGLDADIPLTGGIKVSGTQGGVSQSISGHSGIFYFGAVLGMIAYF